MNNQPPMLQDQDYMRERSDLIAAACGEPLTKEQVKMPASDTKREAFRQALADLGHAEATVFGHWALTAYDKAHHPELYAAAVAREARCVVTIIDKPANVPYIPKVPFPEMEEEPIVSWNGTLMPFSEVQAARAKHHAEMRRIAMAGGWAR